MIDISTSFGIIFPCCIVGILYGILNIFIIKQTQLTQSEDIKQGLKQEEGKAQMMEEIGTLISEGSNAFLKAEYNILGFFLALFALIVYITVDGIGSQKWIPYTTVAFICGSLTSVTCGYIGMRIATYSNTRTAFSCMYNEDNRDDDKTEEDKGNALNKGFRVAFRAGCVMGFMLVSLGLMILSFIILIYRALPLGEKVDEKIFESLTIRITQSDKLYDYIAGYGLGGSTVALFGRVGGGIYTKAADVGADLVGKVENELKEDSPSNPATIADNVGDNVGDIAGMGADLFGSFAESTCACLVIMASQSVVFERMFEEVKNKKYFQYSLTAQQNGSPMLFPLLISAFGIVICIITSFVATNLTKVDQVEKIEATLKNQLLISTILMTPAIFGAGYLTLPEYFLYDTTKNTFDFLNDRFILDNMNKCWQACVCCVVGLWCGLLIGYVTEYMTSHSHTPVRDVAESCKTGPATNIIYGLALGYYSNIVPVIALTITIFVSLQLLGMFGVALAALGMLSNLCIGLAIDGYGPISDNAGGIAEMSELGDNVRELTDALDAAGNTTAAIGKGFAIGSAALVSLSLFGAFVTRAKLQTTIHKLSSDINILDALVFSGLLIGAMLPYAFSAMTMKAVGIAAQEMVTGIRKQLKDNPRILTGEDKPNYNECIEVSTKASLKMMVAPGLLVVLTPLIIGFLFGPRAVAGILPGALVSGVQMAISMSNSGGAWDNAKKFIEAARKNNKDSSLAAALQDQKNAAVIGDTVGDPFKDTSGPSLNILIKLMAILSLVFCEFFCKTAYLVCPLNVGLGKECN